MQKNLNEWLAYLEQIHPTEIELGLTRIAKVAKQLDLIDFEAKVITVGGTNGKGTTCAFLEEILIQAGYKVGVYSSPHIQRYTERLRINHNELSELAHCQAFEKIEAVRNTTSLSFFEYVTLACLQLLKQAKCDFILLEVGLGGRLDATNIVESDLSVVTTVDIDHVDWLGDDREKIGFEKAGIFRANKPVVCGELNPPQSLQDHALSLNANIQYAGKNFSFNQDKAGWTWHGKRTISGLPDTLMPTQNASTALAVIEALKLNLPDQLIINALKKAKLAGRLNKLTTKHKVDIYIDVAHNPQAAAYLASQLALLKKQKGENSRIFAIVGMLEDKDITGVFNEINPQMNEYSLVNLACPRGASSEDLLAYFRRSENNQAGASCYENIEAAFENVLKNIVSSDILIVFGSFYTVSDFLTYLEG